MPTAQFPVLLDTDLGDDIDDAYALAVCLRHPRIALLGVSTVRGDTELRAAETRYLLALEGRPELPVAAGSRDALDKLVPLERNCQAGIVPPTEEERWRAGRQDGVRALAEWSAAHPGAILLTIGQLTNVARFRAEFPEQFALLSRLVIMGGHLDPSLNYAEWNIACDPRAAQMVLSAGKPILMVGLDVTLPCRMSKEDLDAIRQARTPLSAALSAMTKMWQGETDPQDPRRPTLHDPLAALAVAEPEVLRTVPRRVEIDRHGNCVLSEGKPNVDYAVEVDARRALDRVIELVA
jgi:purine nucleosidase/pyrimidine-specific ribonucleoside hydrolase